MGTILKRADELKPGDVLTESAPEGRGVVVDTDMTGEYLDVRFYADGELCSFSQRIDEMLEVEYPDLTPAQQHAEELAEALRKSIRMLERSDFPEGAEVDSLRALLDKIKPPEPPTLEEALESLDTIMRGIDAGAIIFNEHDLAARQLLDRARRAGVWKP